MALANDYLAEGEKYHPYNDPKRWADDGIWNQPSFNVQKYQKKIDRIIGTADGKPIVRLVWAWHVKRWEAGEIRQAYRFYTATLPNGDTCDLSPPRWMLEERFEPGQYLPGWEDVRYIRQQVENRFVGFRNEWWQWNGNDWVRLDEPLKVPVYEPVYEVIDSLGEPPRDGFYGYLLTIADHDPDGACCRRAWKAWKEGGRSGFRCWGYYKLPDEKELQILREAKTQRDATAYKQSPHEPLSAQTLAEIALMERSWNEEQDRRRKSEVRELWAQHAAIWGYRLVTDDPSVLSHGKYRFAPKKRFEETESGLIVPTD